jgi:hypothetical protein
MKLPGDTLVLRDIHQPPAPDWWPPAPGWWIVAGCMLAIAALAGWVYWRRKQRRRAFAAMFDDAIAAAPTPPERIAAMSELLRRAARGIDPDADTLVGDDWLRFLDRGSKLPSFAAGAGNLLRDGAYRRDVPAVEVDALRQLTRARFLDWMMQR